VGLGCLAKFTFGLVRCRTNFETNEIKLLFGKSLTRSPIHHDRYADVIIAPMPDGKSEYRFFGLYTSRVNQHDPMTMPVLRHKITTVDIFSGLRKVSHDGVTLTVC
jgi:NAD-specific glutamate dehydrogenase